VHFYSICLSGSFQNNLGSHLHVVLFFSVFIVKDAFLFTHFCSRMIMFLVKHSRCCEPWFAAALGQARRLAGSHRNHCAAICVHRPDSGGNYSAGTLRNINLAHILITSKNQFDFAFHGVFQTSFSEMYAFRLALFISVGVLLFSFITIASRLKAGAGKENKLRTLFTFAVWEAVGILAAWLWQMTEQGIEIQETWLGLPHTFKWNEIIVISRTTTGQVFILEQLPEEFFTDDRQTLYRPFDQIEKGFIPNRIRITFPILSGPDLSDKNTLQC
jgi:hypothetical protein